MARKNSNGTMKIQCIAAAIVLACAAWPSANAQPASETDEVIVEEEIVEETIIDETIIEEVDTIDIFESDPATGALPQANAADPAPLPATRPASANPAAEGRTDAPAQGPNGTTGLVVEKQTAAQSLPQSQAQTQAPGSDSNQAIPATEQGDSGIFWLLIGLALLAIVTWAAKTFLFPPKPEIRCEIEFGEATISPKQGLILAAPEISITVDLGLQNIAPPASLPLIS
jgi:hypothetical protein